MKAPPCGGSGWRAADPGPLLRAGLGPRRPRRGGLPTGCRGLGGVVVRARPGSQATRCSPVAPRRRQPADWGPWDTAAVKRTDGGFPLLEFHSPNPRGQRPIEYTCPVEPCGTRQCTYNARPQKRLCRQRRRHVPHGLQRLLPLTLGFRLGAGRSVGLTRVRTRVRGDRASQTSCTAPETPAPITYPSLTHPPPSATPDLVLGPHICVFQDITELESSK